MIDRIVSTVHGTEPSLRHEGSGFLLDQKTPLLRLHFVSVYVCDEERSLRFFVDQLGFSLISDARFESGNRWVEVAPPTGPQFWRWSDRFQACMRNISSGIRE